MDADESGVAWGASLWIRVGLSVKKPLKRALKLCSPSGDELLVRFTYEQLPNFCYLCGRLGHIDKYCETRFESGFQDKEETPYGPWLKALPMGRGRGTVVPTGLSSPTFQRKHCPPSRTGAAVFGDFSGAKFSKKPQAVPREHSSGYQLTVQDSEEGNTREEVDSSPPLIRRGKAIDVEMIGVEENSPFKWKESMAPLASDEFAPNDVRLGIGLNDISLNLVNVLLQFTSQH
ncbi:UNVERIFIED_CONTAM: hypothetical protein Slati_4154200 [Sesamum latifolium]|uniref:CCHC-type domain-containing protein n=1 Tax=Sesamum latifolium TaxID=2727402 RepID=A0AAW2T9F8_9LAMI